METISHTHTAILTKVFIIKILSKLHQFVCFHRFLWEGYVQMQFAIADVLVIHESLTRFWDEACQYAGVFLLIVSELQGHI